MYLGYGRKIALLVVGDSFVQVMENMEMMIGVSYEIPNDFSKGLANTWIIWR